MAIVVPRILYDNNAAAVTSVLSASSEEAGFEASKLADQARGRRWRSKTGWTIVPGFNDEFQFRTSNGYRIAHIPAGTYATGAALATALQTAMGVAGYNPRSNAASITCTGWWRADAVTLIADSGYLGVSAMADLSGNNRGLAQATAALQPLWVSNAVDGRPGLYFDGTASMGLLSTALMSALLGANGVGDVVIVFRLDSDASNGATLWRSNTGGATGVVGMTYGSGGGTTFDAYAFDTTLKSATKTATLGKSAWQHAFWGYDQTNLSAWVSAANTANAQNTAMTGAVAAAILARVFTLGGGFVGGTAFKGYILECLTFSNVLDETRRRGIVEYLKGRYPSMAANDATSATGWGSNTNTVSYNTTTKIFTTGNAGATYEIPALTGVPNENRIASCYKDLGYTLTDKTGAASYAASNPSYQSRHFLKSLLTAAASLTAAVALDHNAGASGGTFTQEGNSKDLWLAPTLSQALSGDVSQRSAYFSPNSQRWWRLLIDDVQNSAGYSEVGIWFAGTYYQPQAYANTFKPGYEDLSTVSYATYGASTLDERPQRNAFGLLWRNLSDADRALFETFRQATPVGGLFFLALDAVTAPTNLFYVELTRPLDTTPAPPGWNIEMIALEALP
jgi:hypothetical protein